MPTEKGRYVVEAIRDGGFQRIRLGWDTKWEQEACARRYFSQGWEVKTYEKDKPNE